jgi:hypothetical protein
MSFALLFDSLLDSFQYMMYLLIYHQPQGDIMTFRDQLKANLKAERYNFTHLASESSISTSYLFRILACQIVPSVRTAVCLAMAANKLTNTTSYTPDMFMTLAQELDK